MNEAGSCVVLPVTELDGSAVAQSGSGERREHHAFTVEGLAHDLANMLQIIAGNSILLRRHLPDGSPAIPRIEQIARSADFGAELCQQMLASARRRAAVEPTAELNAVVRSSVRGVRSATANAEIRLVLASDSLDVQVDRVRLAQIVMNLVINAAQAVAVGGGLVTVSTRDELVRQQRTRGGEHLDRTADGTYVRLDVQDNGTGMPREVVRRIFEPFYSTKATGSGLGLSVVASIVREHGGCILVRSEPGCGSCFSVILPRSRRAATRERAENWLP